MDAARLQREAWERQAAALNLPDDVFADVVRSLRKWELDQQRIDYVCKGGPLDGRVLRLGLLLGSSLMVPVPHEWDTRRAVYQVLEPGVLQFLREERYDWTPVVEPVPVADGGGV